MVLRALTVLLTIASIVIGTASTATAASVVHATDFEDCTVGALTGFPGLETQDWWYGMVSGSATAEILTTGGDPGRCLELYAPITNGSGVQTYGAREVDPVDLTRVEILRLAFDVLCRSNSTTTQNLYEAAVEMVGGPHPGYLIAGVRFIAGNDAPRDVTGLYAQVSYYMDGVGGLPIPLTVGQELTWDTWHHVELVLDQANDTFVSMTVDGATQDLTGYHPPRSYFEGEFLRGQRLETVYAVVTPNEWGDPVQETDDWLRIDNLLVQTELTPQPRLLSIEDVGNDQGRQVRLSWQRSEYDGPAAPTVVSYDVYRRQDALARLAGWDFVASVPAAGDDVYQCVVPTLGDSTANGIWWSTFLVRAMTPDPLVHFASAPDSGYSVDDLTPGAPIAFTVAYAGNGVDTSWSRPSDPDVIVFRVYRQRNDGPLQLVCETPSTAWHDDDGTWGDAYRVSAVDDAGNESETALPNTVTGTPVRPRALVLHTPVPNPFNPATALVFELPDDGVPVELSVYDAAGRRVRTLVDEILDHGRHQVVWNGLDAMDRPTASGIYHARLVTPTATRSVKMSLVR